jgi:putative FmdB family regulatory protein
MPTYEYECRSCGHAFEAKQSMSDAPLTDCPSCGEKVRRVMSGGMGVFFKGSGFYKNDSKTSAPAAAPASKPCSSCPAADSSCPAKVS